MKETLELFENVKGLLSSDDGRAFGTIIHTLDEMGYDVQWELLDTENFGVPQHRERVFLVANLRGKPRPKVFPLGRSVGENKCPAESNSIEVSQWRRSYLRGYRGAGTPTLTANMGTGGNNVPLVRMHNNLRLRKLTPTECERLQGLPDGFTRWLKNGAGNITENSDSDRYERCGRTVTSTVIEAIGGRLGYDWW